MFYRNPACISLRTKHVCLNPSLLMIWTTSVKRFLCLPKQEIFRLSIKALVAITQLHCLRQPEKHTTLVVYPKRSNIPITAARNPNPFSGCSCNSKPQPPYQRNFAPESHRVLLQVKPSNRSQSLRHIKAEQPKKYADQSPLSTECLLCLKTKFPNKKTKKL